MLTASKHLRTEQAASRKADTVSGRFAERPDGNPQRDGSVHGPGGRRTQLLRSGKGRGQDADPVASTRIHSAHYPP